MGWGTAKEVNRAQGKQGSEQLLVSNAREMMDDGRRWMMERWNEVILAPAGGPDD
jgi:hypothetical protein